MTAFATRPAACARCGASDREVQQSVRHSGWLCLACLLRTPRETEGEEELALPPVSAGVSEVSVGGRDVSLGVGAEEGVAERELDARDVAVGVLGGDVDRTRARAKALGIEVPLGQRFACVLCDGAHEASLRPTPRGYWRYRCEGGEWGLGELRGLLGYGELRWLSRVERARWGERLDWEAGLLGREPVGLALPKDTSAVARRIAGGIGLFVGLRDPRWPFSEPFPFARRFAMAYCGLSDDGARRGVAELEQRGLLKRVGRSGPAILWHLPTPQATARRP